MPRTRRCACRSAATRWSASRPKMPMLQKSCRNGWRSRCRPTSPMRPESQADDAGALFPSGREGHRSVRNRSQRGILRRNPPAGAGDILWRDRDLLLEAHQLPVVRMLDEGEAGLPGERDHALVRAQRVAENALRTERSRPAFQVLQQRRANPKTLPAVLDRQAELETSGGGVEDVAGFADDGLEAFNLHRRNDRKTVPLADMGEAIEQRLREFAHRTEKAVVAGARRQRAEIVLQLLRVTRLHKAHRHGVATARAHDVGISLQIVEPKPGHLKSSRGKEMAGAPLSRRRRHWRLD